MLVMSVWKPDRTFWKASSSSPKKAKVGLSPCVST
jgi:hypothetical protein